MEPTDGVSRSSNPDVRAESRVWHSLIAGHMFKVSNPERSALKSHGSPLASPNVSPLRSLHGQVQAALPEKVRVAQVPGVLPSLQRHNRAPLSSGLAKKAAPWSSTATTWTAPKRRSFAR